MKFLQIVELETEIDANKLKEELAAGHNIGPATLGSENLFIKKGRNFFYIPYSKIYRAFRRIKAVQARFFRSSSEIQLHYIVLCSNKAELFEFDLSDKKTAVALIEELQQKSPGTKIGVKK